MADQLSPVEEVVQRGLAEGDLEIAGIDDNGRTRYRLTEKGRARIEEENAGRRRRGASRRGSKRRRSVT